MVFNVCRQKEQDGIIPTEHSNEAVDFHQNAAYGEISPSVAPQDYEEAFHMTTNTIYSTVDATLAK